MQALYILFEIIIIFEKIASQILLIKHCAKRSSKKTFRQIINKCNYEALSKYFVSTAI